MKVHAEDYLLSVPFFTKKKNSLIQVREILEKMGNPDAELKMVHVAGTNGKGSVCAYTTNILITAGYRVGTFISPHLIDIKERILLQGQPVSKEIFQHAFESVYNLMSEMMDLGYEHPTFFEYLFLVGIEIFKNEKVDFVILETGLGGLYDTTNVVQQPIGVVITSIGMDHTQFLGNTIEEIAFQKAGIIKENIPVVYDASNSEAAQVIELQGFAKQAVMYPVKGNFIFNEKEFQAPYQQNNANLVRMLMNVLKIANVTQEIIEVGIKNTTWPGRMEEVKKDIWLDGAHNVDGINAFVQSVKWIQKIEKKGIHLLFTTVSDKNYEEMIHILNTNLEIEQVTIAQISYDRGMEANQLVKSFLNQGCSKVMGFFSTKEALSYALNLKTENDRLFIIGSLYLIGEIKTVLE